ncbi:hypothetical protein AOC36_03775 [Erysipelothrix larvae]|uniref:Glutamine--fructose-6-phosphate aminotransferase [isomerizing] n=1 Tax=Erysipelothrix larvae TaxID=1514105 RepID=A0A109UGR2_9FIRM|nr:glutamine--fructose-6-phosphate transaminase (isomerizing) [Erysipelothrix larvae]AMC93122.1 hypothetical protein AOC36_03775 [Erysipelothrix larvae]
MCGIIGYVGSRNAVDVLIDGLTHLAYRGYDSCGIAVFSDGNLQTQKATGKINNLIPLTKSIKNASIGIGHTRWATHGKPTQENAHPHGKSKITLVHNGIIENYSELKEDLLNKGYSFKSETDTEVCAVLLESLLETHVMLDAIKELHKKIEGSYAIAILDKSDQDTIYCIRKGSPLIIGVGQNETFIASDMSALLDYTKSYYILEDDEMAIIQSNTQVFYDLASFIPIYKEVQEADWSLTAVNKGEFETYMLKEIHDQPEVLKTTFSQELKLDDAFLQDINDIHIVACGTAMHAGLVAKQWIEKYARKRVYVEVASEFRYMDPILDKDDLVIVVSQSGETADSLASLRLANNHDIKTLAVVNVYGSSIQREASRYIMTYAGTEIAVASTKAYIAQLATLYQLTQKLTNNAMKDANTVIPFVESLIHNSQEIHQIAKEYLAVTDAFFIGRGLDYAIALEGSLKLKEISYIHAESYPAGELKHGTISLITDDVLTVALVTQSQVFDKMLSNVQEVRARNSKMILIAPEHLAADESLYDHRINIPHVDDDLMPFVAAIPLQLLAYSSSSLRGCDVDQPRNLAKSVTVE